MTNQYESLRIPPSMSANEGEGAPKRTLTTRTLVVLVVATAAPLGVVATAPILLAITGTILLPLCYLGAALVYFLFATGFVRMGRYVGAVGAFYDYVRLGLGRIPGVGASTLALGVYALAGISTTTYLGAAITNMTTQYTGIAIPWWIWSFVAITVIGLLGYREIEASTRVLGALVAIEILLIIIIDVAIIGHGGAHGLDLDPFGLRSTASGSPALGFMFAIAGFFGIEATALYRAETKNPNKTVPRATYISIALIGFFYALSIWLLIEGVGSSEVVAISTADPINVLLNLSSTYVAPIFRDIVQILVLTSTFAAALSFHNVVTRYIASLSKRSILPVSFGVLHPRQNTPSRASLIQTGFVVVTVAIVVIFGIDPVIQVGAWFSGAVNLGMLLLLSVTCVSVIVFFRRKKVDKAIWPSIVAPIVAFVALVTAIILVLMNMVYLTGSDIASLVVILGVLALFGAGIAKGFQMRAKHRDLYEAMRD